MFLVAYEHIWYVFITFGIVWKKQMFFWPMFRKNPAGIQISMIWAPNWSKCAICGPNLINFGCPRFFPDSGLQHIDAEFCAASIPHLFSTNIFFQQKTFSPPAWQFLEQLTELLLKKKSELIHSSVTIVQLPHLISIHNYQPHIRHLRL